jgi:hypothetical protein
VSAALFYNYNYLLMKKKYNYKLKSILFICSQIGISADDG